MTKTINQSMWATSVLKRCRKCEKEMADELWLDHGTYDMALFAGLEMTYCPDCFYNVLFFEKRVPKDF